MRYWIVFIFAFSFLMINYLPAFTQQIVSVETSGTSFEEGDTVVISGAVTSVILDTPVNLQVIHLGNIIEIAQLDVAQDGSYSHTIRAQGPLWQNSGTYIARVSYGTGNVAEVVFEYDTKKSQAETTETFEVDAGGYGTFDVAYTIKGGVVKNMLVDSEIYAIIVQLDTEGDGFITLDLPRSAIDSKTSTDNDEDFIILIDGVEVPYEETVNSDSRILTINFEELDQDIEIIGTFVVPEFGSLVMLILFGALVSTIVISTKTGIMANLKFMN